MIENNKIKLDFEIKKEDYKALSNFTLFFRKRWTIFAYVFIFVLALVMMIGRASGKLDMPDWYFYFYVIMIFFIILIFIIQELMIRRVLRTDKVSFHIKRQYIIDENKIQIKGGKENRNSEYKWDLFYKGYETKKYFLLYVNIQQAFILPKKAMTEEEIIMTEKILKENMGRNFNKRCK
ncbi:YcxB family protein [Anaerovorax odorimutans]|uniref:YcxB family protein n=1 Tax=Anaerovorax odorimutans TaxID=109327 RepID=UPI0003F9C270|nr:YcxB family protein [Anaerovorax odorimutans]